MSYLLLCNISDYYYQFYPEGNEDSLSELDYMPAEVVSGVLEPHPGRLPPDGQVQPCDVEEGVTVVNRTYSNTFINDQEMMISASKLSRETDSVHREEMEMAKKDKDKRQALHFTDNMDNDCETHSVHLKDDKDNDSKKPSVHLKDDKDNDSETHSVIQNLSTLPDGIVEHRVSLII